LDEEGGSSVLTSALFGAKNFGFFKISSVSARTEWDYLPLYCLATLYQPRNYSNRLLLWCAMEKILIQSCQALKLSSLICDVFQISWQLRRFRKKTHQTFLCRLISQKWSWWL